MKRDDAKANAEARNRIESEALRDSTALLTCMAGWIRYKMAGIISSGEKDFPTPEISVFR